MFLNITMKDEIIKFLYWLITTLQLIFMKIITHTYKINNVVFNSVFRAITLPYYIFKLIKLNSKNKEEILVAKWYDILNGILDQLDILLTYFSLSGLSVAEYITFRTFSIVLGSLYLMIYNKKILSLQKMISIILIFIASVILIGFYNKSNLFYSFLCLLSSIAYSLSGFIIEINIKTNKESKLNLYWTKTISYIIALFLGFTSEFLYNTISSILNNFTTKNVLFIIILEIIIAFLEHFYFYLKINSISKQSKNGSIAIQFLDIMRRFAVTVIGVLFFSEVYTSVIYFSVSLMFVGSLIGLVNFEYIIYLYHKYLKKDTSNYNIELPNVSVVPSYINSKPVLRINKNASVD